MTTFVVAGLGGERCKDDPMKWEDIVGSNALVVYKLDEISKGLSLATPAPGKKDPSLYARMNILQSV